MFLVAFAQRHRGRIWRIAKDTIVLRAGRDCRARPQAGDLSVDARDFIQSRLEELRIALQPN
jgi:hypothetical protein